MRRLHVICLTILPLLLLGFFSVQWQNSVAAADACDQNCVKDEDKPDAYLSCISAKKSCLESRIKEAQTQKVTLTNTISIISGRVAVQELQIKQTESELDRLEREVKILTERISGLNVSLDRLSEVLVERVQAHYKASRISHLVSALSGKNLTQVLSRSAYIEETGRQTATAMERAETQRIEYDAQRVIKEQKQLEVETKQKQLETERSALAQQRQEQQYLLQETQSNEQKYQAELAKTLAEITAIQSIIAGKGSEGEGRAVKAGEKIALVGKSGSGKTTLVNLLPRFHDVSSGTIYLDDVPLTDLTLQSLRSQMAYVGQEIVLFNDTVRNNIAYGAMRGADDAQIQAAAEAANAWEFIQNLPQGFDTMNGDNGVLLSGGQRQRLSIARAILSNAPILILDEATSALDTESERHIQTALERLLANRTTFMIAHRLSTIEAADRILVMQDGAVIESGKHAELLALNGQYARLHAMQFHDDSLKAVSA